MLCFCCSLPFGFINTLKMTYRRKHQSGTLSSLYDKIQGRLQRKVLLPHFIVVLISEGSPGHLVSITSCFLQMERPSQPAPSKESVWSGWGSFPAPPSWRLESWRFPLGFMVYVKYLHIQSKWTALCISTFLRVTYLTLESCGCFCKSLKRGRSRSSS